MRHRPQSKLWLLWLATASLLAIGGFAYETFPRHGVFGMQTAGNTGWMDGF